MKSFNQLQCCQELAPLQAKETQLSAADRTCSCSLGLRLDAWDGIKADSGRRKEDAEKDMKRKRTGKIPGGHCCDL